MVCVIMSDRQGVSNPLGPWPNKLESALPGTDKKCPQPPFIGGHMGTLYPEHSSYKSRGASTTLGLNGVYLLEERQCVSILTYQLYML